MSRNIWIHRLSLVSYLFSLALFASDDALAYQVESRWTFTASNTSTGGQGTPITLTWGFVDDGVTISRPGGEPASGSDLIDFLETSIDTDPNVYRQIFRDSYNRVSELSGLTFLYESNNTSAAIDGTAPPYGDLGVRPDLRIGGHSIDGQSGSNTLAYNYFPNHGDFVIDTDNVISYSNSANNYRLFRNVIMHELGHGLGIEHVLSNDAAFLFEPSISTSFDGPQLDDILALQRLYGDSLEKNGGNNSSATATSLGVLTEASDLQIGQFGDSTSVSPSQADFISIDDNSDVDYFSFTINSQQEVTLDLIPRGATYNEGPEDGSQSSYNSKALSNLTLALFDTNGSSIISTSNAGGAGISETITETLDAGTYFARVTGANNDVQLYGLNLSIATLAGDFDGDLDVDGSDFLLWQRTDGSAAGLAAWQSNYGNSQLASAATVPEPSSWLLLSLGGWFLQIRRRPPSGSC